MALMAHIPTLSFVTIQFLSPKLPLQMRHKRYINISTTLLSVMMGGGRALTPAPECAGHGVTGLLSVPASQEVEAEVS